MDISSDPVMSSVVRLVEKAANCFANVLIVGESGVGKTYIARRIHEASPVAEGGFHTLLCYPGTVTGLARADLVEALNLFEAQPGTVVVEGVQNLSPPAQQKLLGYLDRRERTGFKKGSKSMRLIFTGEMRLAPKLDPHFSQRLYMRIGVITIEVPPLRLRRQDIVYFARLFLRQYSAEENRILKGLTPEAERILVGLPWRGNIHELRNTINRAVVMADDGESVDACALMGILQQIVS